MDLSLRDLEKAVSIRREIDRLQRELRSLLGSNFTPGRANRGARPMSSRTRAKLAAAARAQWAKRKGQASNYKPKATRKKGGITPAGRKKLSQLMKARWAARKKAATKKK